MSWNEMASIFDLKHFGKSLLVMIVNDTLWVRNILFFFHLLYQFRRRKLGFVGHVAGVGRPIVCPLPQLIPPLGLRPIRNVWEDTADGTLLAAGTASTARVQGDLFDEAFFTFRGHLEEEAFLMGGHGGCREKDKENGNDLEDRQKENKRVLGHSLIRREVQAKQNNKNDRKYDSGDDMLLHFFIYSREK